MSTTTHTVRDLDGRRVLVTGAGRGTGAAIAARLREAGATVLATARTPPGAVDDGFVTADLTTTSGVDLVVASVHQRLGTPDALVHTLGGSRAPAGGFTALTDEHWCDELALNLLAAVRLDTPELTLIETYLDAHARADVAAATAAFSPTGVVTDDGHTHRGREQISSWLEQTTTDYTYTAATTTSPVRRGEQWTVTRHLEGDFPGGVVDLDYAFTIAEEQITALIIRPV
ncbi:SDR family NAD(P)-dependent oxidoreductase [uncultured Pseudokineococcus sp.]|uniref:SDR family NAD(P)-dependent oxidoreductase n=1 Tax=uncultured Pseudokineococcus sp. TaxID=1642928 RepID=UPI0026358322|nr:SDR family NAD(P)-dependent oxidoreductase [uncultured Pseudokineococcus sp.]